MEEEKHRRCVVIGLVTFFILTAFLLVFVYQMDRDTFDVLKQTPLLPLILLLFLGFSCSFWESTICQTILQDQLPGFSIGKALDVTFLGVFANVATLAAGSVPMQSYYLYRNGLMVGSGLGLMTLEYVFHKVSVLLYATILLCFHWKWIQCELPVFFRYLLISYVICLVIIAALILLCTWKKVRDGALWLIDRLPDRGKWIARKKSWQDNLNALYTQSQELLRTKTKFFRILVLNFTKLFVLYSIPYFCMKLLGIETYTYMQVQTLASLMVLISNALPNIAGMGSAEFSFFLVFSECLGEHTMEALILYRLATYYFPFFLSIIWFLQIQKRFIKAAVMDSPQKVSHGSC